MNELTLDEVKTAVSGLDPELPLEDDAYHIACLLLASAYLGTDAAALGQFINRPVDWVDEIGVRLRANGIWTDEGVTGAEWFEEDGGFAFWLDVACGQGFIEKSES